MENKSLKPKIRFKGFTEAWEQRKFGECVLIQRGGSPRPIESYLTTDNINGINWIKIGDVKAGERYITKTAEKIIPEGVKNSREVFPGDLILSNSMSFGRPYIMGVYGCIHDGWLVIKDTNNLFDKEYLLQLLSSEYMYNQYRQLASGGVVNNLNSELVQNTNILLTNMEEQKKLGLIFKSIDNLITLHQRKSDKLLNIKKSLLEKMFPKNGNNVPEIRFKGFTEAWEQRKFSDVGCVSMCKRIFKTQTTDIGEVPFFKIGTFGKTADSYITKKLFNEYKAKFSYPEKGDILISASGSIGRIVEFSGKDEYFQDSNIVWLKHNKEISNEFLKQLYQIVKWYGIEGTTIQRLYNSNILNTEFKMPSIDEQNKISSLLNCIDNLITLHQKKLNKLKNIKKSLLEKMFV